MTKKICVLAAAVLLTSLSACQYLGKKAEAIPSIEELRREYKKSKDDFRTKYNGKEVAMWGKVDTINNLGQVANLRMESSGSDLYGVPDITCVVEKADVARFTELKVEKGTYARVKGPLSIDEKGGNTIELKPCKLVKIGLSAISDND